MEALSNTLRYDRFIKVIDISFNLASEEQLKHFIKHSLKENTSLVSFVASRNPGFTEKIKKQIALCLLKNIDNFRTTGVEIKDEWIKQENLTFKIPDRIL